MKKLKSVPVVMILALAGVAASTGLTGCSRASSAERPEAAAVAPPGAGDAANAGAAAPVATPGQAPSGASIVSSARKVIRSAELSIEVASPAAAETTVSALAERLGGYVASSDHAASGGDGQARSTRVTLQLRVPAERLDEALREIKRLGRGDEVEKISSEDVTDEYIDVQARVDNQRHLEEQLALLLKQATSIESALKVHQELTNVRTEIDRLEGRRRFLEKESAMAKLSLTLEPHRQVLAAAEQTGFGATFRRAAADAVELTVGLIDFGIRALGFLVPLTVIFGLPTLALALLVRRRRRRMLAAVA